MSAHQCPHPQKIQAARHDKLLLTSMQVELLAPRAQRHTHSKAGRTKVQPPSVGPGTS